MKKFTKVILMIATICVALGFLICIISVAVGGVGVAKEIVLGNGKNSLFVKMDKENDDFGIYFDAASGTEQSLVFPTTDVKSLQLEYEAGLVEIVEGTDDNITVTYRGKNNVELQGDVLTINATDKDLLDAKGIVHVEVPEEFSFENVEMQVGASETNIELLKTKNFELDMGAGACNIEDITCEDMDIEIAAGEVVVEQGTTGDVSVDVGMGNFEYTGSISKDLDANCGMGNIYFEIHGKETEHNYKLECAAGNITIGSTSYSGVATGRTIENENATSDFILKCGMGNIEVAFEE